MCPWKLAVKNINKDGAWIITGVIAFGVERERERQQRPTGESEAKLTGKKGLCDEEKRKNQVKFSGQVMKRGVSPSKRVIIYRRKHTVLHTVKLYLNNIIFGWIVSLD